MLFVEDSEDLREMFVELVDFALNRRCIGVGSYEELVALGDRALGCGGRFSTSILVPVRGQGSTHTPGFAKRGTRVGSCF